MKRKLLLTMVALLSIVGVKQVHAYTVGDLESAGWVQVKDASITDISENLYVLVDAASKSTLMASPNTQGRPYYKTVDDPLNNPLYIWTLEGADNTFALRNLATNNYVTNPGNGWDTSAFGNEGGTYLFTLNGEKYDITSIAARDGNAAPGSYLGPWDDDKDGAGTNNENIAGNKDISAAPGFLLYSISRKAYAEKRISVSDASKNNPVDVTSLIFNADFELKNNSGWIRTGSAGNQQYGQGTMESWSNNNVSVTQYNAAVPNGIYKLSVNMITVAGNPLNAYVYAKGDAGVRGEVVSGTASKGDYNTMSAEVSNYTISTGVIYVSNNSLTVGFKDPSTGNGWVVIDNFKLEYLGNDEGYLDEVLGNQKEVYGNEVKNAEALYGTKMYGEALSALKATTTFNADASTDIAEVQAAIFDTKEAIYAANVSIAAYASDVVPFNTLKAQAEEIAATDAEETVSGSKSALSAAISAQQDAVDNAANAAAISTAINDLRSAIKTYLAGVNPKEGNPIEITALVVNPKFEDNNTEGWDKQLTNGTQGNSGTKHNNQEFWNNTFDFNQTITELPAGSYSLSVQAFCRPGENGDTNAGAYYDYKHGTNRVTAELYVNNDASTIGNIYAYKDNTQGAKEDDFHCDQDGDNYWVPNSQYSASLYFADENVYKTTVAALVEDGTLHIGFRDKELTASQWTIFTNFRLYYYGESKLVYYQQYLPQLVDEVRADLSNGAYANVIGTEKTTLTNALNATPSTEKEYAYAIDAIKAAQAAYRAAVTSYDRLVAALATAEEMEVEAEEYKATEQTTAETALSNANALYTEMLPNVEDVVLGFEEGEYAPYNNVAFIQVLAITNVAETATDVLDAAIKGTKGAELQINAEELNAIYDGSFKECAEDTTSPLDYTPAGWTPTGTMRQMLKNGSKTTKNDVEYEYRGVEELEDGVGALFMNTGTITYGEQTGYEIPLKDAYYKLQFNAASWDGEDKATIKVSIVNGENGIKDESLGIANKYVGTSTTMSPVGLETFELIFRTGAAGNYVFSVNANKNLVVSGFELKKVTDVTVEVSEIGYATFSSDLPLDLANIDGGIAYIVADEAAEDGSLKLTEQTEAVPANTGLLITVDGESAGTVTIPVATEGTALSKNYLAAGTGEEAPVGSYVLSCKYAEGGEEYDLSTVGFYAVTDDQPIVEKGKAYLDFDGTISEAKVLHFVFGDDTATAVEAIEVAETEADGALYNVAGQQVGKDYKGIVIKNGKKYLNK